MKYLLTVIFFVAATTTWAQKTEIFAPTGIALNGYDVVEFHHQKQVKGDSAFVAEWKSVKWFFVSAANLESFKKAQQQYEPQYGGWCAYGASRGYKAPTQPNTWTIINNKLYFNYNLKVKELWDKNRPAYIDSANAKWPLLKNS
jgi:YHS domain-containing protein